MICVLLSMFMILLMSPLRALVRYAGAKFHLVLQFIQKPYLLPKLEGRYLSRRYGFCINCNTKWNFAPAYLTKALNGDINNIINIESNTHIILSYFIINSIAEILI